MYRAIVLGYHHIGTAPKGFRMRSLYVSIRNFAFQMWYLRKAGFTVVPLNIILNYTKGLTSGDKLVSLTFDDGYQDFYTCALPLLKKYAYPATVFVVSDLAGKDNRWDSPSIPNSSKLLDWNQLTELKEHNIQIGSHTRTHPWLSHLSPDELESEISDSKKTLEQKLATPISFFCYPYGDYNNQVIDAVKRSGYLGALTSRRGVVLQHDDAFAINRISVKWNTHPLAFIYKLHTNYEIRKGAKR